MLSTYLFVGWWSGLMTIQRVWYDNGIILMLYDTLIFTYGNGSGLLRILILVKVTAWILDLIIFRMIGQFDYMWLLNKL